MFGARRTFTPCRCACCDDVEHRALVVCRLGEQQLVGSRRLEHGGEVLDRGCRAAAGPPRRPARRRRRTRTRSRRARPRAGGTGARGWPLADEDDPAADAAHLHRLERDRAVRGAQEADRDRARDRRRRDEAVGREVVAGAQTEGEHDQRHGDDRGQQPARPGAPLARRVQTGLQEDEHRDRHEELQPVRLLRPEQAPEDLLLAVHDLPQHEREVEPERQPDHVEHDERTDRERAAQHGLQRPAREEVDAGGADVRGREGRGWPGARLRRLRRGLGRHAGILLRPRRASSAGDALPRVSGAAAASVVAKRVEVGRAPAPRKRDEAARERRRRRRSTRSVSCR